MLHDPLVLAMLGTGFTFAATAVGAAAVFFVKKIEKRRVVWISIVSAEQWPSPMKWSIC